MHLHGGLEYVSAARKQLHHVHHLVPIPLLDPQPVRQLFEAAMPVAEYPELTARSFTQLLELEELGQKKATTTAAFLHL